MRSMTEGLSAAIAALTACAVKAQTFGLLLRGSFAGSALHPQGTLSLDPFSEAPLCKGSPAVWRTEGLSCPFTVKTRRYKQSAKGADLPQRVYLDVNDQGKTQARQCIAQ